MYESQERNPCAPKFEETARNETFKQDRCARSEARDLAKKVYKLKEEDVATFHSAEAWVLPAPSSKKPEEREFVVDSGAPMHMLRTNLIPFESPGTPQRLSQPMRKCKQMRKHRYMFHDLDLFVTVQLLDDTPAVLSLGKLCEEHGYTYERASGQKPHLTKQGINILYQTENFVPLVVPGLSSNSGTSSTSLPQDSSRTSSSPATERKWHPRSTVFLLSSRKIEIAKNACEPK